MGVLKFRLTPPELSERLPELRRGYFTGLDRTPEAVGLDLRPGLLVSQRDSPDSGRLHVKPKQSVNDYLDVWLETVVRPSVRQRTLHGYDETLRLYVRPNLGRLRLTSVTPIEVRAMLVKLRDRGLGPRTVRKAHEVLRNALEQAVADCLIPENPARSRLVKKALPRTERLVDEILTLPLSAGHTDGEIDTVADAVRSFFGA